MPGKHRNDYVVEVPVADFQRVQKLAALGGLAAGVFHELNNPAAALSRTTSQMNGVLADWEAAAVDLSEAGLDEAVKSSLLSLLSRRAEKGARSKATDPLSRIEAESEVCEWLVAMRIDAREDLAGILVDAGLDADDLDQLSMGLDGENLATIGDDPSMLVQLLSSFVDESKELETKIHEAIEGDDGPALRMNAHSPKSNAATFGASNLATQLQELETRGANNELDDVSDLERAVSAELARVEAAIMELRAAHSDASGERATIEQR